MTSENGIFNDVIEDLVRSHDVEGSPVTVIEDLQGDHPRFFGVVGKHRVTDFADNMTDIVDKVSRPDWTTITAVIHTMIENFKQIKEEEVNNEN